MKTEQTPSFDEDHEMKMKALEKASGVKIITSNYFFHSQE